MIIRIVKKTSTSLANKIVIGLISIVIAVAVPVQISQLVFADAFDDQMTAIQRDIDRYKVQATVLSTQANTLQNEVAKLQQQADVIQAQINLSQTKYNQLVNQIADTEQKIIDNQDALGVTIANMYVDGNITPIEMLASSKNISDYLDKQEYQSSIRDQLTSTISKIKDLKTQLIKQKDEVKIVLDKQQAQKSVLVANQSEQQSLLDQTKGQESAYQQLVADGKQKMLDEAAQQRAYYASLNGNYGSGVIGDFQYQNWSGNMGCGSDGYKYCGEQDSYSDDWGLYNRECVSYVAWALSARFHKSVNPFYGLGNAYEWPNSAHVYSGAVRVSNPQPGDAVILPIIPGFSPLGHVMIVESVNGNWMHVSQYNMYGTGEYSTMDVMNSGVILLRFLNQ